MATGRTILHDVFDFAIDAQEILLEDDVYEFAFVTRFSVTMMKLLLDTLSQDTLAKVNFFTKNQNGTILHRATENIKHPEVLRLLLDYIFRLCDSLGKPVQC
jgi:hypothetical protein